MRPGKNGMNRLERVTAAVLLLVLFALAWVCLAAYWPEIRVASTEVEVILVILLLATALLLVSIAALQKTRE